MVNTTGSAQRITDLDAKATEALKHFKDWSNYLLITAVAALGWAASTEHTYIIINGTASTEHENIISNDTLRGLCISSLGISIVFGILTLALIPMVQEQGKAGQSIYEVRPNFWFFKKGGPPLMAVCFPQHVSFIYGVFAFILGKLATAHYAELVAWGTAGLAGLGWFIVIVYCWRGFGKGAADGGS
jgi:hypothetical protein